MEVNTSLYEGDCFEKIYCFSDFNRVGYRSSYRTFFPDFGMALRPVGDGFIRLIKMIVVPIVFSTIVIGAAGSGSMKKWEVSV